MSELLRKVQSFLCAWFVIASVCVLHIGTAPEADSVVVDEWTGQVVADAPNTVFTVAIGDADNDDENENVVGRAQTPHEGRAFGCEPLSESEPIGR